MMTDQRPAPLKPRARVQVHNHHWTTAAEWAAVAAGLVYVGTVVAHAAHASAWMPAGAAGIGLAFAAFMVASVTGDIGLTCACGAAAFAAPGWIGWAMLSGDVWTVQAAASLGVGVAALGCWWLLAYAKYMDEEAREAARQAAAEAARALAKWGEILEELGLPGVRATRVDKEHAGRVVTLRLPSNGKVTLRSLLNVSDGMAAALRLAPHAVAFEGGANAGWALMHLHENNFLAEAVPLPDLPGPATIREPLDVAKGGDGLAVELLFRELGVLVTGLTGAGKTNLLHVLIARFTACVDTVVWVIDLKGGRLAAPWIQPWVNGDCPRPAVDWVATTREEAQLMLRAADAVITARGESLIGGSKLTPSPRNPQLIIVCDETTDLTGQMPRSEMDDGVNNNTMAWLAGRIARKQRSEAVMGVWATQRGVAQSTGTTEIKSQCKLRICLATSNEADARSVSDDPAVARLLPLLKEPGSGVVTTPEMRAPLPVKFYRLDPDLERPYGQADLARIYGLGKAAGHTRPEPDQVMLRAMGTAYTDRWQGSALYQQLVAAGPQPVPVAPALPQAGTPPQQDGTPAEPQADDGAVFHDMMAQAGLAPAKPEPRPRMYAMLADRKVLGMSVMEIVGELAREKMPVRRETVHRWLAEDIESGMIERVGHGKGARYRYAADRRSE